jgi:hypothetical protein
MTNDFKNRLYDEIIRTLARHVKSLIEDADIAMFESRVVSPDVRFPAFDKEEFADEFRLWLKTALISKPFPQQPEKPVRRISVQSVMPNPPKKPQKMQLDTLPFKAPFGYPYDKWREMRKERIEKYGKPYTDESIVIIEQYQQALEQYEKDLSAFKERRSKEPKNTKGYIEDSEAYRDAMQEYVEMMKEYNYRAATYGPTILTLDDFLILKYVYPEVNDYKIVLYNDDIYEVSKYLRGTPINDITFIDKPFKHLKSYHEFLRMNPNISEKSNDSKYQIRASKRSGWTL